jgi:uncharacterized membrane protein YjjP (DUF1212 family)
MQIEFTTALVVATLAACVVLVMQPGDRLVSAIALVTAGIAALIDFRIIALSSPKFRIDVILPAVLVITGAIAWTRAAKKTQVSAATVVVVASVVMVLGALRILTAG